MPVKEVTTNCGFQQIAVLTTAQALTVPPGARAAIIHADAQVIRWRADGVAPTATVGMRLTLGNTLYYDGEFSKLLMIEEAAGAKANISYVA